jgi:hypothetical protein
MYDVERWREHHPWTMISDEQLIFWISSVDDIPESYWSTQKNVLQSRGWLQALETASHEGFDLGYLVIVTRGEITAHCMIQFINLPLSIFENYIPSWLLPMLARVPNFLSSREGHQEIATMVAGDFMMTDGRSRPSQIAVILRGMEWLDTLKSKGNTSFLHVFKDLSTADDEDLLFLHNHGYNSYIPEPEMILDLEENWQSIDDYVQALNKRYRQRYRNVRKRGEALRVRQIYTSEISALRIELQALLDHVLQRSRFALFEERIDFYLECAQQMGDSFLFKVYELEGRIVGFSTAILCNETLLAHRVGINYTINASHKLYQNILYDYIEQAMALRLRRLSFGRTALEIKSAVGAYPQNLTTLMKYSAFLPNLFLRYVLRSIPEQKWVWRNALQSTKANPSEQDKTDLECTFQRWRSGCA